MVDLKNKEQLYMAFSIIAIIISSLSLCLVAYQSLVIMDMNREYQDSLTALRTYDIRVSLEIVEENFSISTIPIPLTSPPFSQFSEDNQILNWLYDFKNADLGIEPTFRFVYIVIYVPETSYNHFKTINIQFTIEDNEGTLRKDSFVISTSNLTYLESKTDISRFMWKEVVPNEIQATVYLAK